MSCPARTMDRRSRADGVGRAVAGVSAWCRRAWVWPRQSVVGARLPGALARRERREPSSCPSGRSMLRMSGCAPSLPPEFASPAAGASSIADQYLDATPLAASSELSAGSPPGVSGPAAPPYAHRRTPAHTGAHLTLRLDNEFPPGPRRPPESAPPVKGKASLRHDDRADGPTHGREFHRRVPGRRHRRGDRYLTAGDANAVIGTAGSFLQARRVVEYAATRTG